MNMGDFQALSSSSSSSASTSGSSNPHPLSIRADVWMIVEKRTQEILSKIEPTVVSEQRRKSVINFLHRLFRTYFGVEVFSFGSVPLKTYLPDGDIDLTALCSEDVEEALVKEVMLQLKREERTPNGFQVQDAHFIEAEVQLIKCLVQNMVVDISFNQLGGISTLCFFEKVDRLIGKDHIFKRSVILIKAWCYYESRILGSHHGLISTYALETLVLYIFQLFHSSLNGPLAVLYRFLDYFSKFEWDKYCVSLSGPVLISSLPAIVAKSPRNDEGELLLSKEFLKNCVDKLSIPPKSPETNSRPFLQKHLNIVDPLKENNNLGRSVNKGNFYRIRCAFAYGARKLGQILLLPAGGSIVHELNNFFKNTLDGHASGQRPDVRDSLPTGSVTERMSGRIEISSGTERRPVFGSLTASTIGSAGGDGLLGLRPTSYPSEELEAAHAGLNPEALNNSLMSDLGGDYDHHLRSLSWVQYYNAVSSVEPPHDLLITRQAWPSQFHGTHYSSGTIQQRRQQRGRLPRNVASHMNIPTGVGQSSSPYPVNPRPPLGAKEVPRQQRTGRPSPAGSTSGRKLTTSVTHGQLQRPPRSNSTGGAMTTRQEEPKLLNDEEFPALPSRAHP